MKKRKGTTVGMSFSLFGIIFLLILMSYAIQIHSYQVIRIDTEDALAASNLASAVIDVEEYGMSHQIIIANPREAFEIYKDALRVNMGLDSTWHSQKKEISGPVVVDTYIIYNVRNTDVEIHYFGSSEYSQVIAGGLGTVTAPNGKRIESTSIYSKISFPLDGVWGIHTTASKDKLVDIVS